MAEVPEGQAGPFPAYSAQNRYTGIRQSPTGISNKPASILRQTWSGDRRDTDPSQEVRGMPPNFGEGALPHVITFQGIVSSVARVYRPSDEAIKDSYDNARFMRNSPDVMECVENRQRSTALLDWHLEPDDAKDATQVQLCEDLTAIVEQIPRFMQMRENLLHALWYGRYATQFRYRWKKIRGQMRLVIDRWLPVNGDKLVFRYDDGTMEHNPDQIGVRVGAGFTTGNSVAKQWHVERINKVEPTDYGLAYFFETWERSLLAIHRHMIEDGEYEDPRSAGKIHGVGIRSRIYWAWYQKQETLAFMMEFLERSATGIEIWYYPWGNPEAEAATRKAAEERIGQGRNIILVPRPLGDEGMAYGVERIEPSMAGVDALQHVVTDYFGHMIKRYILGQTLTTEAESTGLGSNLASVHLDTFLQIVKYDATNLEETLTTDLVEPLKRYNFPKYADIPVTFRIDTESPDVEGKLKAWREAYDMGVKFKSQDVMDLIGAAKPDDTDETLQSPEHQQAQMQIDQQKQQQAAMEQQAAAAQQTQVAMPSNPEADELWKNLQAQKIYDQLAVRGMTDDQFAADGVPRSENAEREKLGTYSKQQTFWNEEDHPRDDDGKFGEGGGGEPKQPEGPKWEKTKSGAFITPEGKQDQADRKRYKDLSQSIKRLRQFQEDVETGKRTKKDVEKELARAGYTFAHIPRMIQKLSGEQADLNRALQASESQEPEKPPAPAAKEEGDDLEASRERARQELTRRGKAIPDYLQGKAKKEAGFGKEPPGGWKPEDKVPPKKSLPDHVDPHELSRLDAKISKLASKMESTRAVWDKPTETPGAFVTGRSNRSQSLDRRLDAENNRKADAFKQYQEAKSEHERLESIRDGYIKGTRHPSGQRRKAGAVEARQESHERQEQKHKEAGFNVRKIHNQISMDGRSTLEDGRTVELDIDFDSPDGGYRFKITHPDGSEQFTGFHSAIAPLEKSGELRKLLKAQPVKHSRLTQQFAREFASRDKYIVERGENYASCYAKGWEEGKHPRADDGKFGEGGGDLGDWRTVKKQETSAEGQQDLFGGGTATATAERPTAKPSGKKDTQQTMFHGMGDLPGQQDLFDMDYKGDEGEELTGEAAVVSANRDELIHALATEIARVDRLKAANRKSKAAVNLEKIGKRIGLSTAGYQALDIIAGSAVLSSVFGESHQAAESAVDSWLAKQRPQQLAKQPTPAPEKKTDPKGQQQLFHRSGLVEQFARAFGERGWPEQPVSESQKIPLESPPRHGRK